MFLYFLTHMFSLKPYSKQIIKLYVYFYDYCLLASLIVVFGNLALMAYTNKNAALEAHIIHNLPLIIKILLIHSFWFYVSCLIFAIFTLFFTPKFARAKNHNIGKILMEVKWQRWRFAGLMYLSLFFGVMVFILFGGVLKMYAFGLAFALLCLWRVLAYISQNSLSITENGVLIGRIFSDIFIPYENLYPLSEKDIKEALDDKRIYIRYGNENDHDTIAFDLIVRNGHQVKENFMNFYNEKVKEFRQNHPKDSNAN